MSIHPDDLEHTTDKPSDNPPARQVIGDPPPAPGQEDAYSPTGSKGLKRGTAFGEK